MSNGKYKKIIGRLIAVLFICALLFSLAGCTRRSELVGEYKGISNSTISTVIKLNKDGTCIYAAQTIFGSDAQTGEWYIDGDFVYLSFEEYLLYADIARFDGDLVVKSDDSGWNDEYYKKVD